MKISTKGRYALRMMIGLAQRQQSGPAGYVPLKEIAEQQAIELKYLEQIAALLKRDGLIQGVRGSSGGYRLVRSPSEYTVREILLVTEGSLVPVACLETPDNLCPRRAFCRTLSFWQALDAHISAFLERWTLQDLLDGFPDGQSAQDVPVPPL